MPLRLQTSPGRTMSPEAATSAGAARSRSARTSTPSYPVSRAIRMWRSVGVVMIVAPLRWTPVVARGWVPGITTRSLVTDDAERQARHDVAPSDEHQAQRDHDRDHPARSHVVPDDLELRDQPLHTDRERHRPRSRSEDEREQEFRPVE